MIAYQDVAIISAVNSLSKPCYSSKACKLQKCVEFVDQEGSSIRTVTRLPAALSPQLASCSKLCNSHTSARMDDPQCTFRTLTCRVLNQSLSLLCLAYTLISSVSTSPNKLRSYHPFVGNGLYREDCCRREWQ